MPYKPFIYKKGDCRTYATFAKVHGSIHFNKFATEKFNLDNYSHCVLYYDDERKIVGVKPTTNKNEKPIAYSINVNKNTADICCKSFFEYFDIGNVAQYSTRNNSIKYYVMRDEITGFLNIHLGKIINNDNGGNDVHR